MKEITGLRKLRETGSNEVYCPKCRSPLRVVMNGFFHGEVFFCPNERKVFSVQLREVKASEKFIEESLRDVELDNVRRSVSFDNVFKVKKFIDSNPQ